MRKILLIGCCLLSFAACGQGANTYSLEKFYNKFLNIEWYWGNLEDAKTNKKIEWLNAQQFYDNHEKPSFIGLDNLKGLTLNDVCELSPTIGDLKSLESFSLSSNCLTFLPEEFANIETLEYVRLQADLLQHLPKRFTKLKNIKQLSLDGTNLKTLYFLDKLEKLMILEINDTPLNYTAKCDEINRVFDKFSKPTIDKASLFYSRLDTIFKFNNLKNLLKEHNVAIDYEELASNDVDCLEIFGKNTCEIIANLELFIQSEELITNEVENENLDISNIVNTSQFYKMADELLVIDSEVNSIFESSQYINYQREYSEYCEITTFPKSLKNLNQLMVLQMNNTLLTKFPECFLIPSLIDINLNENSIISLPNDFGKISNLMRLSITDNKLTSLPSSFKKLTNLKIMDLTGNSFSEKEKEKIRVMLPNCEIHF